MAAPFWLFLCFMPQPEGGYTVTSPPIPELLTEGDTFAEALQHVQDALDAIIEMYAEMGRPFPWDTEEAR